MSSLFLLGKRTRLFFVIHGPEGDIQGGGGGGFSPQDNLSLGHSGQLLGYDL